MRSKVCADVSTKATVGGGGEGEGGGGGGGEGGGAIEPDSAGPVQPRLLFCGWTQGPEN